MFLKFTKTFPEAITPVRANLSDAGLDVFFCPKPGTEFHERNGVMLHPTQNAILPTGIKMAVPHGYALIVFNRSGNAAGKNLLRGACVIDAGYGDEKSKGEIFIDLHNVGHERQLLQPGDKIAQLLLVPVISFGLYEVEEEDLYTNVPYVSDRGGSGFGSTDKQQQQPKVEIEKVEEEFDKATLDNLIAQARDMVKS